MVDKESYLSGWNDALEFMEKWFKSAKSKCGEGSAKQCRKVREEKQGLLKTKEN